MDDHPAPGRGVVAAVVAVGDELLSGRTVDTNSAWLGRALAEAGVPVARRFTVGDRDEEIGWALGAALQAAELVVFTGGLGPTHDDRTLDAVAGQLGLPLELDRGLLDALEERFRARGYARLPPSNRRQARVPRGGEVLPNRKGTAPGVLLAVGGRHLAILPGVPGEMRALVEEELLPRLRSLLGDRLAPLRSTVLLTTGIAESVLAGKVEPLLEGGELGPVSLAFLPRVTGVELRLSLREGEGVPDAAAVLAAAAARLAPVVAPWRYRGPDLVDDVALALGGAGLRMATAESCTGGLLGKRLTDRPGASAWYVGGVVAYDDAVKRDLLGVEAGVLQEHGAVSEAVALAMARGVARRLGVEVGVSITGVAGPGGGSEAKPVGMVWMAAWIQGRGAARMALLPGDRDDVRERAAQGSLHLLLQHLEGST